MLNFASATKARSRTVTLTRPSREEILHFAILGGAQDFSSSHSSSSSSHSSSSSSARSSSFGIFIAKVMIIIIISFIVINSEY